MNATVAAPSAFTRTAVKTGRARTLRRDATHVERQLWQKLRAGQVAGVRFRRQHPAGPYSVDFYCPALGLAIELDGGQHALEPRRDRVRDAWLADHGVTVVRFWNSDVTENLSGVLEAIATRVLELKSETAGRARAKWN
ncbi:MAG: endonuclease domain-containing protein [Xanthobacteraceae bacterium]